MHYLVVVFLALLPMASDKPLAPAPKKIDFVRDIEPILDVHCLECHGADRQRGGLRLDEKESALRGSENGKVIIPGKSDESILIDLVSEVEPGEVMPPKGKKLTKKQVDLLRAWIDQGAKWPD